MNTPTEKREALPAAGALLFLFFFYSIISGALKQA